MAVCREVQPVTIEPKPGHLVACHLYAQDGGAPAAAVAP
jgi:hypothetical protein